MNISTLLLTSWENVYACEFFQIEFTENAEPQNSHEYGYSLLCISICLFKCELHESRTTY